MKNLRSLTVMVLFLASFVPAHSAILFSGAGDDSDLTVTITEDMVFTLTAPILDNYIAFSLNGVYAPGRISSSTENAVPPTTSYVSGIQAELLPASGGRIAATGYDNWGTIASSVGIVDSRDFYGMFRFTATPTSAVGDTFVIKAGTIVFEGHPINGMPAPDFQVTTIQLMNSQGDAISTPQAVPEPHTFALAGMGVVVVLLARRRRGSSPTKVGEL